MSPSYLSSFTPGPRCASHSISTPLNRLPVANQRFCGGGNAFWWQKQGEVFQDRYRAENETERSKAEGFCRITSMPG